CSWVHQSRVMANPPPAAVAISVSICRRVQEEVSAGASACSAIPGNVGRRLPSSRPRTKRELSTPEHLAQVVEAGLVDTADDLFGLAGGRARGCALARTPHGRAL